METGGGWWECAWKYKQETILAMINTMNYFSSRRDGILDAIERTGKGLSQKPLLEMSWKHLRISSMTRTLIVIITKPKKLWNK